MIETSDLAHHLINGGIDLGAAYVAHHFAPHVPRPTLLKRHLGWAAIVLLALPLQFVVYESYAGEKPAYLLAVAFGITVLVALGWLCHETATATVASSVQPGE